MPFVANVMAAPGDRPGRDPVVLVRQVTGTVRWRESVAFMAGEGVGSFYEVGSGKVLTGLVKRIAAGAAVSAIGTPDDVAAFSASRKA